MPTWILGNTSLQFTVGPIVHSPCFKLFVTFRNTLHLGLDGKRLFNINPLVLKFMGFVAKIGIELTWD